MRFAGGCLMSALVLAGGDVLGFVGPWAFPAAAVVLLFASVVAAVAMEQRDFLSVAGLVASSVVLPPSAPASAGAELPGAELSLPEVA